MEFNSSLMIKKIAFRADGNHNIGIGHLVRCIRLAKECISQGMDVIFVTSLLPPQLELLISTFEKIDLIAFNADLKNHLNVSLCVMDLSYNKNIEDTAEVDKFITCLHKKNILSLVIDGLHNECLLNKVAVSPQFALFPYLSSDGFSTASKETLIGAKYAILPDIKKIKRIKKSASNILISFGGSDPTNFSIPIAKMLLDIDVHLSIIVIIGPDFSLDHVAELQNLAKKNSFSILKEVTDLSPYLANADIALISTGLTKYETAAIGTPTIHFSTSEPLKKINHEFCQYIDVKDLGPDLCLTDIKKHLNSLIDNKLKREKISHLSTALVDGKGRDRVVKKIAEWINNDE
jgi:UDP-2,4-diacetamido-2,4,6-trideoxy-beta-L-altropyranose hydrolase